jgi:hypothetical protein
MSFLAVGPPLFSSASSPTSQSLWVSSLTEDLSTVPRLPEVDSSLSSIRRPTVKITFTCGSWYEILASIRARANR